jgi:tetratricopeptide (TPR) repeat protein
MNNDISIALSTLRLDPDDVAALAALAALAVVPEIAEADKDALAKAFAAERAFHADSNCPELCLRLIDLEIGLTQNAGARAGLLVEKARLLWKELWRCGQAHEALAQALQLSAEHAEATVTLRELEAEEAGWQEQAEALSAQAADAGEKPVGAAPFAAEGELLLRHRNVTEEAEAMFRRALALDARNQRAACMLERLLRRGDRQQDLAAHLTRRIDSATTPAERAAAELAAARLAEKMDRQAEALEHYREAIVAAPGDERIYFSLEKMFANRQDVDALAKIYEAGLRAAKRGQAEVPAALALGELTWKRLKRLDDAEQFFRRVRKAQPMHPKVIAFYREYHLAHEEIPQLLALLGQAQKNETDPEARIRYGIEIASVAERRPQLLEKAIDAWKVLLRMRPGLPEAVAALRRLYTKAEKWNALLELLKDRCEALPASDVDGKVECYLDMVPIYRDRLKLEVMVINTYAAVLSLRPDHAEALTALAERYEAQGRWGDLAGVLTRQAQALTDPAQKVALLRRIATLWIEKFGNHHNAIAALEKLLEIEPTDGLARTSLREIYTRGRSWRALLDLLRRELGFLDAEARRSQLSEMAVLAAERLADLRQAIALWNEVLELAPADRAAVSALAVLYEREKRWPALAEILGRLAEASGGETSVEGCALLERRGLVLLEKLGAGQAALETLRRVHAAQPENPRVLRALREAYTQTGDIDAIESLYAARNAWDDLCDVLSGLAERTADMRLRARAFERVADVARNRLGQNERVIKAYEGILATEPGNRVVARAAAELYEKLERWGRLVATYDILLGPEAEPALPPEESLPILERARAVCETKLQSKSLAFKWCARAFRLRPADATIRSDLERLGGEAEEWEALLGLFIERLDVAGDAGPNPEERLLLFRHCLSILVNHVDRPTEVQRIAETILAEVPGDAEAERALVKLFTEKERWAELVALQRTRQRRIDDASLRAEALLRISRVEEEKLGDRKAAVASLQEAVQVEPENVRALRELARLLEVEGDFHSLVAVLSRQAGLGEENERAPALLRLGKVYESELADHKEATRVYLEVLEIDNIASGAVEGLERMFAAKAIREEDVAAVASRLAFYYELTENYVKWAGTLESLVETARDAAERRPHLEMLADLYAGPLGDSTKAYAAVRRIFEIEPADHSIRERLVQLAELVGKLPEVAESARRILATPVLPVLRQELLLLVADVEERQPERLSDAEAALREVLEIDPLHVGAYRSLCRMCKDSERWGALRDIIAGREKHLPDNRQRVELLWQIIEIDEGLLYDRAHASATLRRIIELDATDLKAYRVLERHYAKDEKWRELDALLVAELSLVAKSDLADLKLRRAELALAHFDDAAGALHLATEALDLAPAHAQAIPLLEKALGVSAVRPSAAAMLDGLYAGNGNWTRLVEILDIEREGASPAEVIALLARKAELQEKKLEAPAQAFSTWRSVLELDAHAERALAEVERLGASLGQHAELIAVYQALADKRDATDVAGVADLLSRAARLCMARVSDGKAAIAAWRRVLDLDPTNAATGAPAGQALETLYTEAGDMAGLVDVLRAKSDWAGDVRERGRLLLRVADLQENRLDRPAEAVETYRGLLDGDAESARKAFENLDRMFMQAGQARERVELLKHRLDRLDNSERRTMRFLIASIEEKELADLNEAVTSLRPILDVFPEDNETLTTLARLYQSRGAHVEHLEILDRLLQLASNDFERVDRLRQIAALLQGPLGRPAEALDRLRDILRLVPKDAASVTDIERMLAADDNNLRYAAAEALEPLYVEAHDYTRLAGILRILIELSEDGHTRAAYRMRLAGIEEDKLGDKKAAFQTWSEVIRDATGDPELDRLLDSYERLAEALGSDTIIEIVELYRAVEPEILADTTRMRVQQTIAEYAMELGDLPLAIDYLNRIIERRPDDDSALSALETIYEQRAESEQLYEVLLRRADLAQDAKAEQALRRRSALLAAKLGRHEDAIAAWERVSSMSSGNAEAVAALDALYTELGRWDDLTNLLERRLELGVSAGDAVDLRFRLAEIQRVQLANRLRALEYLAAVLARAPDHSESIRILEEMLGDPEVCVEAANLLEPVYIRRNAWKDLVGVDSLRLRFSEDPEMRLAWTQRIAQVYEEQIEDFDEAFDWYGRVFQEKPTDLAAQEQLLRLAPKQNRWRDLGRLLDEYLDNELSNSDDALAVLRIAIQVHDLELGDHDTARRHYRRYLEAQPGDQAASRLFEEALERWQDWRELRNLLDEQANIVESSLERVALLHRSAELSDGKLEEPAAAIEALRAILEVEPNDKRAAQDLDGLLLREGRWEELRDHLQWMLARAEDAHAKDGITLELAKVDAEQLENRAGAVDLYGEVLARTPANLDAIAALESLLADGELRAHVAELLEPAYRTTRDLRKLADLLEIRLEALDDPVRRIAALREIASIELHLGRSEPALEARGRAWLEDVSNAETLVDLESQAAALHAFERLVGFLDQGARLTMDPDLRGDLHAFRANILDARLAAPERAIEAWREALAARPDFQDAFIALERLYADANRVAELCETIEKHAEVVVEAAQREKLTRRVADLYESGLGDPAKAIAAWRSLLDLDQEDQEALEALSRLYLATADWQSLAEILVLKIASCKDPGRQRELRFQAAELYDGKLGQPSDAAEQLRRVLEVMPDDADALASLAGILLREKQHGELVEILDRWARIATSPKQRDALMFQAARIVEQELLDMPDAIRRYQNILDGNRAHAESSEALWALCRGEDHRVLAIDALEPLLRLGREWKPLRELLELRLAVADAPVERIDILSDIAQVEESALLDPAAAFATWARALAEDASCAEARAALERLAQTTSDFAGLADIYEERLKAAYDSEIQRWLGMRLAEIYEGILGKPERAVELWREIETSPGSESMALARQETLLRALGRNQDLADVLAREAELATDRSAQADFWTALGELRLGPLADSEGAIAAFRSALEGVPRQERALAALRGLALTTHPPVEALDILEPLAQDRGDFGELVALLESRLTIVDDASDRASLLGRIAEIHETKLGDAARAIDALGRALLAEPAAPDIADRLERVADMAGALAEAATRVEAALGGIDTMLFAEMALRAARLYLRAGGTDNEEAARKLFVRIMEADPENAATLEELDALYRRRGDSPRLAEILERRGALELDPSRRLAFYGEAAGLLESVGNVEAAVAAWRKGRESDETNATAIDELARLYETLGQRENQVEILREKARLLDDAGERSSVFMQIVSIKAGLLDDLDGAVEAVKEALDADPGDARALGALVDLEELRGDFVALEEALLRQSAVATGQELVAVLGKLARNAAERLNDAERALVYYQQILTADPRNPEASRESERLLSMLERWHELIELLERRADAEAGAGDKQAELGYRVKIAGIWGEKLGAEDSALDALCVVLERDPAHFSSLVAVARICVRQERWEEANQALENAAAVAATAEDVADVLCRRAEVRAATGGTPAEVAAHYQGALSNHPRCLPAIAALEEIARKSGDHAALATQLLARANVEKDEGKQKAILAEVATLYLGPLAMPEQAVAPLERLAKLSPADLSVQENLGRALVACGRVDEGEFALGQLIEHMGKARRQKDVARLQCQLGGYAEARGDLAAAKQRYAAAYQIDPTQAGVLGALARLSMRQHDAESARRYLRTLLLQSFDEKVAGITKAEVYLALGNLHREAGENAKARNMFERGLETDPKNEVLKQALAATPK